ncbi:hypothetical protein QBC43DRAFT_352838 [Cladorrhinum sp. PSN259]|nr:hypothetical protein QBC43DRAFT_352838 [Cladorrhinum sp. PSN259]
MADANQIRTAATSALVVAGIFGLNSMFGQIYRNGHMRCISDILTSPDPVFPNTQTRVLTKYTMVPPLDRLLTLGTVLWANVADGSAPALSLYALQFGGQLVPVYFVFLIEGSRAGHVNTAMRRSVFWGLMMQTVGYAITMPVYGAISLFTSPTLGKIRFSTSDLATAISPSNLPSVTLEAIIPSFLFGYFLPSVLMGLPVSSAALHQWFGALWQGFPLYVSLWRHFCTPSATGAKPDLSTYGLLFAAKALPALFPPGVAESLTFAKVFAPGPIYSTKPASSMATATHDFFKWDQYVGSAAALIWGVAVDVMSRNNALQLKDWMLLGWEILRWTVVAGPAGAVVRLLQRRDKAVLEKCVGSDDKMKSL